MRNSYYSAASTDAAWKTFDCGWCITNKILTRCNFTIMLNLHHFTIVSTYTFMLKKQNYVTRCDIKTYF